MKKISVFLVCLLLLVVLILALTPQNPYKSVMHRFAEMDSLQKPESGIILFTGSSSITNWQDIDKYFPGYKILNRGFGGSQFSDLITYSDKVIFAYHPSQIFIYEGDNDLWEGKTAESILANAKTMREMIAKKLPGVPVYFISAKPSIARWALKEKYLAFNEGLKLLSANTANTEFVDVWTPMIDPDGKPYPVFLEDNLHMTHAGYEIWKKTLEPYLKKTRSSTYYPGLSAHVVSRIM